MSEQEKKEIMEDLVSALAERGLDHCSYEKELEAKNEQLRAENQRLKELINSLVFDKLCRTCRKNIDKIEKHNERAGK